MRVLASCVLGAASAGRRGVFGGLIDGMPGLHDFPGVQPTTRLHVGWARILSQFATRRLLTAREEPPLTHSGISSRQVRFTGVTDTSLLGDHAIHEHNHL